MFRMTYASLPAMQDERGGVVVGRFAKHAYALGRFGRAQNVRHAIAPDVIHTTRFLLGDLIRAVAAVVEGPVDAAFILYQNGYYMPVVGTTA